MEEWKSIPSFHNYAVSNLGLVRNEETGRVLAITRNKSGVCHVGLSRGKKQFKRSLGLLVANAFVDKPNMDRKKEFNVPIHLDGIQSNNRADNLLWRPHWFAMKYMQQFNKPRNGIERPILEVRTQDRFPNTWEAALAFGLIERELKIAILQRTFVWPTFQEFRIIA